MKRLLAALFLLLAGPALAQNTLPSASYGDMIYRGPTIWSRLLPGPSGAYLRTNGPNQPPTWEVWSLPSQATNTLLGNVTGTNAIPTAISPTQFLDVVAFDVLRPQADPGTILYRGIGALGWQKLPPGTAGSVLTTAGLTAPPFWSNAPTQTNLDAICATWGSILYRATSATGWVCLLPGAAGQVLTTQGPSADPQWATPATGTVTSVALTMPAIFSVAGSPITTTGTLAATLATQAANLVFAGPTTGAAATPTFRALVGADLPNPAASTLGGIQSYAAVASQWINAISTSGVPSSTQPAFTDISGSLACAQHPALTGDVTTSACAATIAANVVSYAKMQQVVANRLLGNSTGSTANASEVALGAAFTFASGELRTVAFTGDITTPANSVATTLASVIVAGGPTGSATVVPIITWDAKGRVTVVSSATIAPPFSAVTGQATLAQLPTMATMTALANITGSSTTPTAATITSIMDAAFSSTQGSILYRNASAWVALTPGTNGWFLKTQGAAANPVWAAIPGGGDLLAANNLSDVASAATAFTNIKQAATETATGVAEIATQTEVNTGTDDTRIVTPLKLAQRAAFSAHKNGTDQTGIADVTLTKVTWPTEIYDNGGFFASDRWTPPAGRVALVAAVRLSGTFTSGVSDVLITIYKNGVRFKDGLMLNAFVNGAMMHVAIQDVANGTDYYEVFVYADTVSGTTTAVGTATLTYFMGMML